MRKWILYSLGVLGILLLSGCSSNNQFPPGQHDVAVNVLHNLFGVNLSNFLSGKGYLLTDIFRYFNLGLLGGIVMIAIFITIAGAIFSAQDGVFLGRKWGSVAIPVRATFGSLAVVPMKSGFCFAQYFIMFVVYAGISLANSVWNPISPSNPDSPINKGSVPAGEQKLINELKNSIGLYLWNATIQNNGLASQTPPGSTGAWHSVPVALDPSPKKLMQITGQMWLPQSTPGGYPSSYPPFKGLPQILAADPHFVCKNTDPICQTFVSADSKVVTDKKQLTDTPALANNYYTQYNASSPKATPPGFSSNALYSYQDPNNFPGYIAVQSANIIYHVGAIAGSSDVTASDQGFVKDVFNNLSKKGRFKLIQKLLTRDEDVTKGVWVGSSFSLGTNANMISDLGDAIVGGGSFTADTDKKDATKKHDDNGLMDIPMICKKAQGDRELLGVKDTDAQPWPKALQSLCDSVSESKRMQDLAGLGACGDGLPMTFDNDPANPDPKSPGKMYQSRAQGWFCAGNRYLTMDKLLASNMKALAAGIGLFTYTVDSAWRARAVVTSGTVNFQSKLVPHSGAPTLSTHGSIDLRGLVINGTGTGLWANSYTVLKNVG